MQDTLVESQGRTVRGNRVLISLRLLLATLSLALLLIQEYTELHRREKRTGNTAGSGMVTALAFSADNKNLYSAGRDGFFRIWDIEKGREIGDGIQCGGLVTAIRPDQSGKMFALGMADQHVRLLELGANQEGHFRQALDLESTPRILVWSPDGTQILTGGGENPLKLWDTATGKPVKQADAESTQVVAAGFISEKMISSLDNQGRARRRGHNVRRR